MNLTNLRVEATIADSTVWGNVNCSGDDPPAEAENITFPFGGRIIGCVVETSE